MNIIDLFDEDEIKEKSDGNYKGICPCCETSGYDINIDGNISYCHKSKKWFSLLETAALKLGLIECIEGNDKGEIPNQFREERVDNNVFIGEIKNAIEKKWGSDFLTDFNIAIGDINDLLIKKYTTKGVITSITIDVDAVAKYLIRHNTFKTICGKTHDHVWWYDGKKFIRNGREIIKTETEKLMGSFTKKNNVSEIHEKIIRLTATDVVEFEKNDINLIPLRNGVLDIKNKKLISYSPCYNFKFVIDNEFNSNAKCPNWEKFLNEALYPEDIPTVQEWFGFNLFREYVIKKGMIIKGPQDTGKSVFLDTMSKFIGEENKTGLSLQKLTSGSDFTKLSLKNKHSNIYDDLSSTDLCDGGSFKMATGGGYISAEEKFGEFVQFRCFAKQLFATNKIPPVKDNDDMAYFGRWMVLSFDNIPDILDPHLRNKLWTDEEMSGILNWALIGLFRLLETFKFSYTKTPEETKLIMESSGIPLVMFAQEVLEEITGNIITKEDMFNVYMEWAILNKKPIISKEQIGRNLPKYCHYVIPEKHKVRIWKNVGFISGWQENYDNNSEKLGKNNSTHKVPHFRHFSKTYIESQRKSNKDIVIGSIISEKVSEVSTPKNPKSVRKVSDKNISDRDIQFRDSDECKDMKITHTKEEVLEWIKLNPKHTREEIYEKFGSGCLKFKSELKSEGLI